MCRARIGRTFKSVKLLGVHKHVDEGIDFRLIVRQSPASYHGIGLDLAEVAASIVGDGRSLPVATEQLVVARQLVPRPVFATLTICVFHYGGVSDKGHVTTGLDQASKSTRVTEIVLGMVAPAKAKARSVAQVAQVRIADTVAQVFRIHSSRNASLGEEGGR